MRKCHLILSALASPCVTDEVNLRPLSDWSEAERPNCGISGHEWIRGVQVLGSSRRVAVLTGGHVAKVRVGETCRVNILEGDMVLKLL